MLQTLNPTPSAVKAGKRNRKAAHAKELADMVFGMKVVKHVKSNAIVLVKDGRTVGIGAGQMNRVGAAEIALKQAGEKAAGSVLASDAFSPRDTGCGGKGRRSSHCPAGRLRKGPGLHSRCNEYGLAMVFTGIRYFKH